MNLPAITCLAFGLGLLLLNEPEQDSKRIDLNSTLEAIQAAQSTHSTLRYMKHQVWLTGESEQTYRYQDTVHEEVISQGRIRSRAETVERRFHGSNELDRPNHTITIDDGIDRYFYVVDGDVVGRSTGKGNESQSAILEHYRENFELQVLCLVDEKHEDSRTIIEGTAKGSVRGDISKVRLEFNGRGLLVRATGQTKEAEVRWELDVTDIRYNIEIDPQQFVFVLPPGMKLEEWQPRKPLQVTKKEPCAAD